MKLLRLLKNIRSRLYIISDIILSFQWRLMVVLRVFVDVQRVGYVLFLSWTENSFVIDNFIILNLGHINRCLSLLMRSILL